MDVTIEAILPKPKQKCADNRGRQVHKLLINAQKVLIAAVNGPAVGYGTSSIALFDLLYAVPDAIFFTPFV